MSGPAHPVTRPSALAMLAGLVLIAGGCANQPKELGDYQVHSNIEGLSAIEQPGPGLMFARLDASLADYDRFIVEPVSLIYTDPSMKELEGAQVGRMQQYFRNAIIRELEAGGYEVGSRTEPGTLRVSLRLTGLKASTGAGLVNLGVIAAGASAGVPVPFAISVGDVTFEAVFNDATSFDTQYVVVERSAGSHTLNPRPWSTWADIEAAFDDWAVKLRAAVDAAQGVGTTPES